MLAGIISLNLTGCGTVTPDIVKDHEHSFDASTPPQYDSFNSGLIDYRDNAEGKHGALITPSARARYNNLIDAYRIQFKETQKVELENDSGIEPYTDQFKNELYFIHDEYLAYFMRLNRWNKNGRADDSFWLKFKDTIVQ